MDRQGGCKFRDRVDRPRLAIGRLRLLGADRIVKTAQALRDAPKHALWIWGITDSPLQRGT